jgi:hypothetical protein
MIELVVSTFYTLAATYDLAVARDRPRAVFWLLAAVAATAPHPATQLLASFHRLTLAAASPLFILLSCRYERRPISAWLWRAVYIPAVVAGLVAAALPPSRLALDALTATVFYHTLVWMALAPSRHAVLPRAVVLAPLASAMLGHTMHRMPGRWATLASLCVVPLLLPPTIVETICESLPERKAP